MHTRRPGVRLVTRFTVGHMTYPDQELLIGFAEHTPAPTSVSADGPTHYRQHFSYCTPTSTERARSTLLVPGTAQQRIKQRPNNPPPLHVYSSFLSRHTQLNNSAFPVSANTHTSNNNNNNKQELVSSPLVDHLRERRVREHVDPTSRPVQILFPLAPEPLTAFWRSDNNDRRLQHTSYRQNRERQQQRQWT